MKSLKLAIAFLLAAAVPSFADGIPMDTVFSSLTERAVTSGDFSQEKTSPKLRRPLKSSGKFVFSRDGIVWQTLKPFPSTMAVTKDAIIQTGADGKRTVLDGSSSDVFKTVASSLSSLFSGNRKVLEKHFTIRSYSSKGADWTLSLAPKDATVAGALKDIVISGSSADGKASLDEMKISQNDSNTTTYRLTNQTYRQELTPNEKALLSK